MGSLHGACASLLLLCIARTVAVSGKRCSDEGAVKLVDGRTANKGRVEICVNARWSTACSSNWTFSEAHVTCRELGFIDGIPTDEYSSGSTHSYQYDYLCTGDETHLQRCPTSSCSSSRNAGVVCSNATQCNETDVRLVDGRTPHDGRVEICLLGVWGSVCDDWWDIRDAQVVCRQLGYDEAFTALQSHRVLASGTLFYHLDSVACNGNEELLSQCVHGGFGIHDCVVRKEEAGVICNDGHRECHDSDVRLVDGLTTTDGRVEICLNGLWGSVCDDYWDERDAAVVCRQLGYNGPSTPLQNHPVLSKGLLFYHLDNVQCSGNESMLSECQHNGVGFHNCYVRREEAGVICTDNRECTETDVRLVNGQTPNDGRVEVCSDGSWTPVCYSGWDSRDAKVVCQQLGYNGSSYPLLMKEGSKQVSIQHKLNTVNCTGVEVKLSECGYEYMGPCRGQAGVLCSNETCEEGLVYLLGGDDVSRGRVLYCYNGTWYSVCADDWDTTGEEARVICRTIGYNNNASVLVNYGRGTIPILPLSIRCTKAQNVLSDCLQTELKTYGLCKQVAGVDCIAPCASASLPNCSQCSRSCYNQSYLADFQCSCHSDCFSDGICCSDISATENCFEIVCEHGAVRLVGGVTNSTGRLEFCAHGVWGRVCNTLEYWSPENTKVVCHQLGFSTEEPLILDYDPERFGTNERAVIGEVRCVETEQELLECSHSSIGSQHCGRSSDHRYANSSDIIISCSDEERECENGEVKIQGWTGSSNGYVEFCQNKRWTGVCNNDGWDNLAKVVCRQLGFDPNDARQIDKPANAGSLPVFLAQVTCNGSEQYFNECIATRRPPTSGCNRETITCFKSSSSGKCARQAKNSTNGLTSSQSYGVCSMYKWETAVCDSVVRPGIDSVYARSKLGNQRTIAQLLNIKIRDVETLIDDHDSSCVKQAFRALCYFYLPPCGNSTHFVPPSSICQEQCYMIQNECRKTWKTLLLAFKSVEPVIQCNDTSKLLFPVAHCCTDAGISMAPHYFPDPSTVHHTPKESSSLPKKNNTPDAKFEISVAVSVLVVVGVLITTVLLIFVLYCKMHGRKKMKKLHIQQPVAEHVTPVYETVNEELSVNSRETGKEASKTSVVGPNPYSEPVSTNPTAGLLEVPASTRVRVSSCSVRELSKGKFLIKSDNITLQNGIGEGEFGIVYKAKLKHLRRAVAVKTLKGNFDQAEVDKFVQESLKMSRFSHPHVMSLTGVCLDAGSAPYIIMPYMANGSLIKYLKRNRGNIILLEDPDEDELREVRKRLMVMCHQIASGMEYLSEKMYIHRDLAARNCMIDAHFLIKVSDFGLSEEMYERNYFRQTCISGKVVKLPLKWMAPESLSDGHFSEKSDVWSYGVTMWEIFSGGKVPYPGTGPQLLIQSLEKGFRMPQPYNDACSDEIYEIMKQCWKTTPEDRPTFKELCSTLSKSIERIAGYLQIGYNPFMGDMGNGKKKEKNEEKEEEVNEEEEEATDSSITNEYI